MMRLSSVLVALMITVGCVSVEESIGDRRFSPQEAADSRIDLGVRYMSQGEMQRARDNFQQALTLAPNYYRTQLSLAYYYQQVGESEKADEYYRMALRRSPKNGDVLNNYGVFLCREKAYDDGLALFERAVELPNYNLVASSYENAGLCAISQGEPQKAQDFLTKALAHDPQRPVSMLQLSQLQLKSGDFSRARTQLMKFNKQFGYRPESLLMLIKLEDQAGRLQERNRYAKLLASQYPDSQQYQQYLADDY